MVGHFYVLVRLKIVGHFLNKASKSSSFRIIVNDTLIRTFKERQHWYTSYLIVEESCGTLANFFLINLKFGLLFRNGGSILG